MSVVIGIALRYTKLDDGRYVLYLVEKVRRCIQKTVVFIIPICQVQDCDYTTTKYNEFKELSKY